MKDTIIKGSGNSRTLKTVPNALTLYPDFAALLTALVEGTFPIDLGPLNSAGLEQLGTALNKVNLLSDSTETAIWGSNADRTVDQALAELWTLIKTTQTSISEKTVSVFGSYVGTGEDKKTLTFPFRPSMFCFSYFPPALRGHSTAVTSNGTLVNLKWSGTGITISKGDDVFNKIGVTYSYYAIS